MNKKEEQVEHHLDTIQKFARSCNRAIMIEYETTEDCMDKLLAEQRHELAELEDELRHLKYMAVKKHMLFYLEKHGATSSSKLFIENPFAGTLIGMVLDDLVENKDIIYKNHMYERVYPDRTSAQMALDRGDKVRIAMFPE